jgi:hypothetical protein
MPRKQETWKPPPIHFIVYGSLEDNPPPVDLRPQIRELLKTLDAVLAALDFLPAEGSATPRDCALNEATWYAWRKVSMEVRGLSDSLKTAFQWEAGEMCENIALGAAANQAINWLAVYAPQIRDWMTDQRVQEKRRLPPFPKRFRRGLELSRERLREECAAGKPWTSAAAQEARSLRSGDEEMFADFTRMQRKLLAALQGERFLTLPAVMKAVYGTDAKETSALEQLVSRTNQALTTKNLGLEIKRKSNTWSLQQL